MTITLNESLTIGIALGVALIGWFQYRLEQQRLKLELFEKRFAVYESVLAMIKAASNKQSWPDEADSEFQRQIETSRFLFPREVTDYITIIRKTIIDFAEQSEAVADTRHGDADRPGFLKLKRESLRYLREEYSKVASLFVPHMTIEPRKCFWQ
jgi:hypothetical protein